MSKVVFIAESEVPEHIMKDLRQRRELDENDTSEDQEILKMSGFEFFDEWLKWNGFIGYTRYFLEVIEAAYGIDLTQFPFDEPMERIVMEE